jgi:uncharacterized protein YbjT (DUF2867 family)
MNVFVCGATGSVGHAVVRALRSRGHHVIEGARRARDGARSLHIDYMQPRTPAQWAEALRSRDVQVVVNAVGILMPAQGQSFERVHTEGPLELFRGARLAGVHRIVQVSALGVCGEADALRRPYLRSKLLADDALPALGLDWAVLRPSLVYGPRSQSAALFATLSALPVIGLPGRGAQRVQPIHVYELAEIIVRLVEAPGPLGAVHELGGSEVLSYREMLQHYRDAQRAGPALWLPMPMALMRALAWASEGLPQHVFCRDTIALLERGSVAVPNDAPRLLGRAPSAMGQGLAVTPPEPRVDLHVDLSPAVAWSLRASLAFMWLYTALVSAWLPHDSGVLALLARCGFEGRWGVAALVASCSLNIGLGLWLLWRPTPLLHALQCAAIVGYSVTAAFNMPELTIDHCGPLVKNVPLLAAAWLLWMARPHEAPARPSAAVRREAARVRMSRVSDEAPARTLP